MEELNKKINEVLQMYFQEMFKNNNTSRLSEELVTGMIIRLQPKLIEAITPLLTKEEKDV